jgi:hypothetical protein
LCSYKKNRPASGGLALCLAAAQRLYCVANGFSAQQTALLRNILPISAPLSFKQCFQFLCRKSQTISCSESLRGDATVQIVLKMSAVDRSCIFSPIQIWGSLTTPLYRSSWILSMYRWVGGIEEWLPYEDAANKGNFATGL